LENGLTIAKMPPRTNPSTAASQSPPVPNEETETPAPLNTPNTAEETKFSARRFNERGADGRIWVVFQFDPDLGLAIRGLPQPPHPFQKTVVLDLGANAVTGANLGKLANIRNIRAINFSESAGVRDSLTHCKNHRK